MTDLGPLLDIILILAAMVGISSIFVRLKLGTTLGQLAAGIVIGPAALDLVQQSLTTAILGELGVVFLLFAIGLELPIARIRTIGARIMALGVLQVGVTAWLFAWIASHFGMTPAAALAIGAGLALSSTTIVLRQLTERGLLTGRGGRAAFAILMVQDLLVGPILVTIMALSSNSASLTIDLLWAFAKSTLAVSVVFLIGHRVLDGLYRPIAASNNSELFTALSFLVVIGLGYLTHEAGLSLAFGGFLAGVLLADTHYRHQVSADFRSMRGLLLGVFFVTIGMQIEPSAFIEQPLVILAGLAVLLTAKALIIILLGLLFRTEWSALWRCALMLAQGGEFAFVLWATAQELGALPPEASRILILIVAISMAITPLLFLIIQLFEPKKVEASLDNRPMDDHELSGHVIVLGCGTVGAQVVEGLHNTDIQVVAMDTDAEKVRKLRQANEHCHLGDASHPEMLEMVHVERALAVVVAIDDKKRTTQIVGLLRYLFDDLPIMARAMDEAHAQDLEKAGATTAVPEIINTGQRLIQVLNLPESNQPKALS